MRDKFFVPLLIASLVAILVAPARAQTFTTLYNFAAPGTTTNNFGANPQSGLLLSSNTLYGTTYFGGSMSNVVTNVTTNGFTNFVTNVVTNGFSNNIAASNGYGTVYAVNTDGTGYTNLINFTYATIQAFSVDTNVTTNSTNTFITNVITNSMTNIVTNVVTNSMTNFVTNVVTNNTTNTFTNGEAGTYPYAGLVMDTNNNLYGATSLGGETSTNINFGANAGNAGSGTVFVINLNYTNGTPTNGGTNPLNFTNFTTLQSFSAANIGSANVYGGYPIGGPVLTTDTLLTNPQPMALCGTAYYGGDHGYGTVYISSTDTNEIPIVVGAYVTNFNSNNVPISTNFSLTTNSGVIGILHSFDYTKGALPEGPLLVVSNTFYGTAAVGGTNGNGVIYSVDLRQNYHVLYEFSTTDASGHNSDGTLPKAGLILSTVTNTLYGTASEGGAYGYGTIFAINTDGTGFTNLYSFSNGADGAFPSAALVLSNNTLFGTASQGGSNGTGTVFAINTDGTGFATVYSFSAISGTNGTNANGTNSDGAYPVAGLTLSSNTLYGTAALGGTNGAGTIFSIVIPTDYSVSVSASPAAGGMVSGSGSYPAGSTNIVTAVANTNYTFVNWTQNGEVASTNATYPATVNGNLSLVANFTNDLALTVSPTFATKQFQKINLPAVAEVTYGATPFSPGATSTSGLPISYTRVSGPATISGNMVIMKGTGTVVLAANQPGSTNYFAAKQVLVSFKVKKAPQSIIFPEHILAQTAGTTTLPITLPVDASSGLKVTVRVKSGPAKISGKSIVLTGKAGVVVLEATQPGNANYLPAPTVTTSFVVNPK